MEERTGRAQVVVDVPLPRPEPLRPNLSSTYGHHLPTLNGIVLFDITV